MRPRIKGLLAASGLLGLVQGRPGSNAAALLEQAVRASIIAYLKAHDCASVTELCRECDISWGAAQHHLYVLRKAGLVQNERHGRHNLFFHGKGPPTRARILALLRSPRARQIMTAVSAEPGIRQKQLVERLHLTRKVLRHHMDLLVAAALLQESKVGTARVYQPTDLLRRELGAANNPPVPAGALPAADPGSQERAPDAG